MAPSLIGAPLGLRRLQASNPVSHVRLRFVSVSLRSTHTSSRGHRRRLQKEPTHAPYRSPELAAHYGPTSTFVVGTFRPRHSALSRRKLKLKIERYKTKRKRTTSQRVHTENRVVPQRGPGLVERCVRFASCRALVRRLDGHVRRDRVYEEGFERQTRFMTTPGWGNEPAEGRSA